MSGTNRLLKPMQEQVPIKTEEATDWSILLKKLSNAVLTRPLRSLLIHCKILRCIAMHATCMKAKNVAASLSHLMAILLKAVE